MNKLKRYKTFSFFLQKQFSKNTFSYGHNINCYSKKLLFLKKNFSLSFSDEISFFALSKKTCSQQQLLCLASKTKMEISEPFFFNFSFDKNRLKNIVSWFFEKYGQYKTILFLERLKEFGFGYATTGGISLGIDDLKIPDKKIPLISTAETKVAKDLMDYRNAKITGIERTQRLIYTWNQTNDMLKQEVLKYFETMDLFNPIYMMAFSGARGNMSQVRQLVGMRGLMSDPQGQIIDFPIQSNFCEGLTLTEYLISTYGARKGIVDTALRTATAGYLTRRLVDVAQHVIVSQFDCGTSRGIFLFDMKEANKTIYSFQTRLIGRVLAQDILNSKESTNRNSSSSDRSVTKTMLAARNQEIDSKLAFAIAKVSKKALVRSPLTCETPRLICQLCYGWSLSQSKLVAVGEAVGVIAAQSIGEPGTQLTMRTFHTGGVFAGGLTNQILAPFNGRIQYVQNIPGSCIRTSLSEIAFLTKMPGSFFVVRDVCLPKGEKDVVDLFLKSINYEKDFSNLQIKWKQKMQNVNISEMYKIPAYAVLYLRNNERVRKKQILAQFSTVLRKSFQYGSAEQTFYSNLAGEFILNGLNLPFKKTFSKVFQNNLKKRAIAEKTTGAIQPAHLNFQNENLTNIFNKYPTAKKRKKIHLLVEKRGLDFLELSPLELKHDVLWKSKNWTNIWILSGKIFYHSLNTNLFVEKGDFLKKTSVLNRILWKKKKNWNISFFLHVPQRQNFCALRPLPFASMCSVSKRAKQPNTSEILASAKTNSFDIEGQLDKKVMTSAKEMKQVGKFISTLNTDKMQFLKTEAFFIEQNFKKITLENFCSSLYSSTQNSFANILLKKNATRKNKILLNRNVYWKNSFISCVKTKNKKVFSNIKLLPFSLFFLNIFSSSKQNKIQNTKLNKSKNDILFSRTFHKIFFFSSLRKEQNFYKKLSLNNIVYTSLKNKEKKLFEVQFVLQNKKNKNLRILYSLAASNFLCKKKHLKQVFFKFATSHRTTSFFRFSSFSRTFNSFTKFVKMTSKKNFVVSKKRIFPLKLPFLKYNSNNLWCISNQLLKTFSQFKILNTIDNSLNTSIFNYSFDHTRKKVFSLNIPNQNFATKQLLTEYKKIFKKKLLVRKCNSTEQPKNLLTESQQSQQKLQFPKIFEFPFFKSLVFKKSRISQNLKQSQNLKENLEKQILFKKTVFSFDYTKIRYNKYGYVFSFQNSSKNQFFATRENNFQIFTKLKQSSFDFKNVTNPGKRETNISFGNGNYIGKDFPTFLSYYFPKNYQTITNGIFTIRSFENNSKKQRYKLFFCLKQKTLPLAPCSARSFFTRYAVQTCTNSASLHRVASKKRARGDHSLKPRKNEKNFSFLQKTKNFHMSALTKERKNAQSTLFSTKFQYLQNQTFYFINKKMHFRNVNLFEKYTKKKKINYFFVKNSIQKSFEKTFSLFNHSLENQKVFVTYGLKNSSPSEKKRVLLRYLKKYNFIRFSRSELYTEEIFWIPQENFIFPILDFYKLQQKNWFSHSSMNNELLSNNGFGTKQVSKILNFPNSLTISSKTENLVQNKKNEYIYRMIFKKNPLFFLSNSQGKKKPIFSVFEGIWNYSISQNKLKYTQFSPIQHRKNRIRKKFHTIQQKFSLYKLQKEKIIKKDFSIFFLKKSSVKFLKLQTWKLFRIFKSGNSLSTRFFCNSRKNYIFYYSDKKESSLQKAPNTLKNNNLFFFCKKKNNLKILSKFDFQKKLKHTMQRNFLFSLQKKMKNPNFGKIKNLFLSLPSLAKRSERCEGSEASEEQGELEELQKTCSSLYKKAHKKNFSKVYYRNLKKTVPVKKAASSWPATVSLQQSLGQSSKRNNKSFQYSFSTKNSGQLISTANIQKKIGKILKNQCFTCIPFKKTIISPFLPVFPGTGKKNIQKSDPILLEDQQLHLKIQSGWICVFPNSSCVFNKHQRIMNTGHFFGKDFCFEQNKILQEVVVFEIPALFSDVDFHKAKNLKTIPFSNSTNSLKEKCDKNMNILKIHNSKNTKISFSLKSAKKNHKSRFSNHGSLLASRFLASLFAQKMPIEKKEKLFRKFYELNNQKTNFREINKNFPVDFSNTNLQNSFSFNKEHLISTQNSANKNLQSESLVLEQQLQKKIALFIRPMQYRLLENPKNYKKFFLKKTIQTHSIKSDSISFVSSLKIYKKYHSIILNIQKPNKNFIQKIENIESKIKTDFQKIYKKKKSQKKKFSKQAVFFISNKNKNRNNRPWSTRYQQKPEIFLSFDFSKNFIKVPHFQLYSKKTRFFKFQHLLTNNTSKFLEKIDDKKALCTVYPETNKNLLLNSLPQNQTLSSIGKKTAGTEQSVNPSIFKVENTDSAWTSDEMKVQLTGAGEVDKQIVDSAAQDFTGAKQTSFHKRQKWTSQLTKFATAAKTNCSEKMFFSFYPIQFLPLSISNSSLNIPYFERKNSQMFSTIFYNFLNNKIQFSLCHKKAAFLNQRFHSFDIVDKFTQTSSFWLNNDGKNIYFLNTMKKNIFKNYWNKAFLHSICSQNQKNFLKKKRLLLQSNIHIKSSIFKNFLFQKNQNFYANTQFLSPFDGELLPMFTNELNWWKKASEISTIQKLNTFYTVISKKDLFSFDFFHPFKNKKNKQKFVHNPEIKSSLVYKKNKVLLSQKNNLSSNLGLEKQEYSFNENNSDKLREISLYSLKTKQKHLKHLYESIKNQPTFDSFSSLFKTSQFVAKNFFVNKIIKTKKFVLPESHNNAKYQISSFVTKYENKIYKFKNFNIGYPSISKQPRLGKYLVAGDCIFNFAIRKPGQIVHLSSLKTTLRRGQPFLVSPKGILHFANTPYIEKNVPILTLSYQTLQSGDIVQGIPKVEQFFEARTTIQGRLFISSIPILLKGIFQRYKTMLPLEQAVQQSFLKIQQLIVDGVQRVYRLQGVSIVDKHLEVIVRQMTTKVQIIHGAQTGFFPGELVNLDLVERINKFLMVKVRYEPIVLGITRASLEVDSFLSASSFQQTTKILALASISRKKDFLKGLKENILVGNLIPSGTGFLVLGK